MVKLGNKKDGFTLVEIIVAISILAMVALVSIVIFKKDDGEEFNKNKELIISAATTFSESNAVIDMNILKETGRTLITVGELIDAGYLEESILNTSHESGEEILRDTKIAVYLTKDEVDAIYYSFNGNIDSSLSVIKKDKKIKFDRKSTLTVRDLAFNDYVKAYDQKNNNVLDEVKFEIFDESGNKIKDNTNITENFDTYNIKNYKIKYSYVVDADTTLTEEMDVEITGKYVLTMNILNTNQVNKTHEYNKNSNINLSITPNKISGVNYIYGQNSFVCKGRNDSNITNVVSSNKLSINNINEDITCSAEYVPDYKYVTLNVTNGSFKSVSGDGVLKNGKIQVLKGKSANISFNNNTNYTNSKVTCNGSTKYLSNNVLYLSNITSDMTCNVEFKIPTYSLYVSISNGTYNGSSSYSTSLTKGSNLTLDITPKSGYVYDYYSCGSDVTFDSKTNKLTVSNISSNKYCYIYYEENNLYNRASGKIYDYNNPLYIKYGNYTWIAYEYSYTDDYSELLGIKMILDRTAGVTSFSSTACCDTGVCTYANNNFINNYIGKTVLTNFYNTLPTSKSNNLVVANYNTGYFTIDYNWQTLEDHTSDRKASSVIGMLEDDDSWIAFGYEPFYENSYDKLTWTTVLGYQYNTAYGRLVVRFKKEQCGNTNWNIYELVNTKSLPYGNFYSQYGTVYPPDTSYYYRPVIVMDENVKVKSGEGTKANPLVIE